MKKRRILAVLLSMVLMSTAMSIPATAQTQQSGDPSFYDKLVDNYTDPDIEYQSEVRWWMAEGLHTDETLEEEIQAMYDAGFRGFELCQLNDGNVNAGDYGYGSDQWNHDFHLALNKALDLGMTVGLTSGTHWGTANIPGLDPDSQAANQCLFQINETINAGQSRTGAIPTNGSLREKATFVGAYAYKKAGGDPISQESRIFQTRENASDPSTFSIELDFIIDKDNAGFGFGGRDNNNFLMWQINTKQGNDTVTVRPHLQVNGGWAQTDSFDVTNAIGYKASEIIGKQIHMKIVVNDGKTIDTYFNGSNTSAFTYNIPTNLTGDFTLGKLMFRHMTDYGYDEEIARYDNFLVKDGEGNVVFEENFDDPADTGFDGGVVVDGMLKVGVEQTAGEPNTLDPNGIIDLTDKVVLNEDNRTGTLDWTAPDDGNYLVMYYWQQGTAQESYPATKPAYCINYFDERGLEALKDYWLEHVLNDPVLNEKIKEGDVQLFMDSLEFNEGSGFSAWTEDFVEEFEARKGYDITPYMVLSVGLPSLWSWDAQSDIKGTYSLTDKELGQRIMNDLFDVQTQLYMENMMEPFKEWLNSYGIKLRAQISYGKYLEISEPIQVVDYPEAENRNQRNQPDMYRLWTGGSHLQNKVLSTETGGLDNSQYSYDYDRHLQEAYAQYAVGFSRVIWHIWAAQYGSDNAEGTSLNWPGYEGGMAQFYKFGLREPSYSEYGEFNNHLGRVQQLLREGKGGIDVGMPYLKYGQHMVYSTDKGDWLMNHDSMFFPSTELQDNGYTYDYFSPDFLTAEDVSYDAETGTLELAGYKAIVLWQDVMTIEGAEALLDYAKQGLKIVVVDGAAVESPYNNESAEDLAAVMAELKAQPTVKTAATADDVLEALQAMDVVPYAGFAQANQQLLTQVRRDGDNRYLYLYNYCDGSQHDDDDVPHGTSIDTEIVMDGTFIPYFIDAWSGEVVELANYRHEDGKTIFPISLDYGDVALYAFEAVDEESLHVVSTGMDSAYVADGNIVVRGTESGTYYTELSDGSAVAHTIDVPQPYDITGWDLTVESWTPGEKVSRTETLPGSDLTTTEYGYTTNKTDINVKLDKLTTWDNIPEVGKTVSGKGYYSATFNWDGNADGAYLDFGDLTESMQVFINGQKTTDVNMITPIVDISDLLIVGENTIEINYSSNLTNIQLSRGIIGEGSAPNGYKGYEVYYNSYGPHAATIIPYVEDSIALPETETVLSAEAPASAQVNSPFVVSVVTSASITDVRLYNENDMLVGRKNVEVIENTDGTKTFNITTAVGTVGEGRTFKIVTLGSEGYYKDSGVTVSLDITSVAPVLTSFDLPNTTAINQTFVVKATTDMNATGLAIYNENGMKMGVQSLGYEVVDGYKMWTGIMSIGTQGERSFTAYAVNQYGVKSQALSDSISVKPFA